MNRWPTFLLGLAMTFLLVGTSCTTDHSRGSLAKPMDDPHQPLFLHVISPTFYFDSGTQPPQRILTTLVYAGRPFAVTLGEGFPNVSGLIELRDHKFHGKMQAANGVTTTFFDGNLELERPVSMSEVSFNFSGVTLHSLFVLSTNSDCKPSLERQTAIDKEKAAIK